MATYTSRAITSTRHEWIIPAAEPWGAAAAEIGKAWTAAERAYREHHGTLLDDQVPDDALRFHVTDDAIVITFTAEGSASC